MHGIKIIKKKCYENNKKKLKIIFIFINYSIYLIWKYIIADKQYSVKKIYNMPVWNVI